MMEWINELFGIKNEVSVPTLISLIVFLIGGLTTYIFGKIGAYSERKKTRRTVILLLKEILTDLKTKEMNTSEFYPTVKTEHHGSWYYPHKPISYLETFFELDFNQIYYSFRRKFYFQFYKQKISYRAFHKIWATLRSLRFMEEKLEKHMENMMNRFNLFQGKYNEKLDEYRQYHDDLRRRTNGIEIPESDKHIYDYLVKEDQIWMDWQNIGEKHRTAYFNTYNKLIVPMLELNRANSDVPFTSESDNLLLSCAHQFVEIENTLNVYNRTFKTYFWNYRHHRLILKKCIELIK